MIAVELVVQLFAGEHRFVAVDHDHEIARIHVRRERGFVFSRAGSPRPWKQACPGARPPHRRRTTSFQPSGRSPYRSSCCWSPSLLFRNSLYCPPRRSGTGRERRPVRVPPADSAINFILYKKCCQAVLLAVLLLFLKKFSPSARGTRRPHGKKRTAPKGSPPHDETGSRFSAPFQRPSSPFRAATAGMAPARTAVAAAVAAAPAPLFLYDAIRDDPDDDPHGEHRREHREHNAERFHTFLLAPPARAARVLYAMPALPRLFLGGRQLLPFPAETDDALFRKMKNAMTAAMSTTTIATVHGQLNMR